MFFVGFITLLFLADLMTNYLKIDRVIIDAAMMVLDIRGRGISLFSF
jgi:hypothetical protein